MAAAAVRSCAELVQRLSSSSSSSEQRQAAAAALLALPMKPQTWVTAVGAIPALVQMLTQQPSGVAAVQQPAGATAEVVQQLAMQVMRHISSYQPRDWSTVRAAPGGLVAALVPLLHHSREDVCGLVATNISGLATNFDNQVQFLEAGAVAPLVQLLKSSALAVHMPAAMALAYLSENEAASCIRIEIVAAGAIAPLLHLLKSSSELVQLPAVKAVRGLCYDDEHAVVVARAGGVSALVRLLTSLSVEVQEEALEALAYLSNDHENIGLIAAAGAIPRIVKLLASSSQPVQYQAAASLVNPAARAETHSAMLAAGAVKALVHLLKSSSPDVKLAAAQALANFAIDNAGGLVAIAAAGAIAPLVPLLRATCCAQTQVAATMLLRLLARSNSDNASSIVSAGALPLLVKLSWGPAPRPNHKNKPSSPWI